MRRPDRDNGSGAVAARDIAGVGETAIDGPDGVGVDPQGRPELTYRREPNAWLEAPRIDLVGELPVDLGGDRDVRISLDVEGHAVTLRGAWIS